MQLRRVLGLTDLVFFNIAALIGIRWLAAAAQAGPGSITLWLLAAALFFMPSALAVAGLSARYPEEGGLYVWTKREFGEWHGFLCGWCYWLSNLFYFPNLLVAGVGMAGYALGLAEDKAYILGVSLALLWLVLLANLAGLSVARWTNSAGALASCIGGGLLIVAAIAVWTRTGPATPMQLIPHWDFGRLNFWSQIAFAFGGLELGAILAGEIRDPGRNLPRAAWISGAATAAFYILGTLAMLALLPSERISIISGLAQAADAAGAQLTMPWLGRALTVLVLAAVAGQLGAWMGGNARLPFVIGIDCYLPPAFSGLRPNILIQGVACTVFLLALQAGESLRTTYQLLVDMSVITYFIPFLYLFGASWRMGRRASAACGAAVTALAIALSMIPPSGAAALLFELKIAGGCALLIAIAKIIFHAARKRR